MSTPNHISDYQVVDVLGRGGMGVVYQAVHGPSGATAAVKTVRIATETTLESIRREIHTLRELRHPGVVSIREHGVVDGMPWYAMDLLRGRTLRDDFRVWFPEPGAHDATTRDLLRPARERLEDSGLIVPVLSTAAPPYSIAHVATLFRNICEPLAYVHGQGVIHRDLSPANIFLVGSDRPVLFDFGLASQFRTDSAREMLEVGGLTRGTAHYMAPEQARGEVVDARADVYALGCILYEALTGRPPFLGDSALAVLMRHIDDVPDAPSVLVPGIPRGFDELVMQMLAKRPRDRIGYAEDVAIRLERLGALNLDVGLEGRSHRAYTYRPGLAGRTSLLDTLDGFLLKLVAGTGGFAVLAGESGVGKTRLAGELATRAHDHDIRVITGECEPIGVHAYDEVRAAPLHPLRPLLRAIADRCRDGGAAETQRLLGPSGGLLAAYEPALAGLAPVVEDRLEPQAARFRVLAVLRDAIRELTTGAPTLLVLDDLQWADELTLALLGSLDFAQLDGLFVLATVRAEEMTTELEIVMRGLDAKRFDVPRLDAAAVGAMVRDMLALEDDAPTLTELIAARSEGNPLFAAEYVRAAVDEGVLRRDEEGRWRLQQRDETSYDRLQTPGSVQTLVTRRLRTLGAPALDVAMAAAVLGRSCDAAVLAAVAEMAEEAARIAVMELIQRQVLHDTGDGQLRFVHDKLREQAYGELTDERRTATHRRAAVALEARYAADATPHLAELANHWEQAGDAAKAAAYLDRAAQYALDHAAYGEARVLLEKLVALPIEIDDWKRARWEYSLGEACYASGFLEQTAAHMKKALSLLGHALPDTQAGWSAVVASGLARQVWANAVGARTPKPDPTLADAALASARMTSYYFFNDDAVPFLGCALRAVNLAERGGEGVPIAEIYAQLGYIAGLRQMESSSRAYFAKARAVGEATKDPIGLGRAYAAESACHIRNGAWHEVRACANRALAIAEELRNSHEAEVAHTIISYLEYEIGDYDASLATADVLYNSAMARTNRQHASWAVFTRGRAQLQRGLLAQAIANFEQSLSMLEGASDRASLILSTAMLACAQARAGQVAAARVTADKARLLINKRTSPVFTIATGFASVADAYLELWRRGDASVETDARTSVDDIFRLSKSFPMAAAAGYALDGVFRLRAGSPRRARAALAKGLAIAQRMALPYDQAIAHHGLSLAGGPGAAQHGETARRLFERLGCKWHLSTLF